MAGSKSAFDRDYRNGMDVESDNFNPAGAYAYRNGADVQSDSAFVQRQRDTLYGFSDITGSGLSMRAGPRPGLSYGGVRAVDDYDRNYDFDAGAPRAGMKWTDDGWQHLEGPAHTGLNSRPLADATDVLKENWDALGQGWKRQGWSVLQGDRQILYDLGRSTRDFLGSITGYDATNTGISAIRQGDYAGGALKLVQGIVEAGTTALGFGVGTTTTGLRVGTGLRVAEGSTRSKAAAISDDTFVRFDPSEFNASIGEFGVQTRFFSDGKVWLTKYGDIKNVTNPADLETMLYRKNLWPSVEGKFNEGATLRAIDNATGAIPSGVTNKTNGVRQWHLTRDIPPQDLRMILELNKR